MADPSGRCRHRRARGPARRLRPDVVRAVVAAAETAPVPIVRPRYAADDAPEPGRAPAGRLAARRGGRRATAASGPLLAARPDLVLRGRRWTARTRTSTPSRTSRDSRAYRDPRCRLGAPPPPIAWSPRGPSASGRTATRPSGSARRRRRTSTPRSRRCSSPTRAGPTSRRWPRCWRPRPRTRSGSTSGPGAGRYALPLALVVREVIAVEPSARHARRAADGDGGARDRQRARRRGRVARVARTRWATCRRPTSALIAHVGYDIEAIGPFLDAMEAATRERCVAVLTDRSPASVADPFWPLVHGEDRVPLPALPDLLEVLHSRGRQTEVIRVERPPRTLRLGARPHGVPPPPAVHLRRRREGPPLPGGAARPDRQPRRRLDAARPAGWLDRDRDLGSPLTRS